MDTALLAGRPVRRRPPRHVDKVMGGKGWRKDGHREPASPLSTAASNVASLRKRQHSRPSSFIALLHSFFFISRLMSLAHRTASTFRCGLYRGSSPRVSRIVQNTLGPSSCALAYCFAGTGAGCFSIVLVATSFISRCIAGHFRIGHSLRIRSLRVYLEESGCF